MKNITKDDNGFPLNFDPSSYYILPEHFEYLDPRIINIVPYSYSISTWGRLYNHKTGRYLPAELIKETNQYVVTDIIDINGNAVRVRLHQLVARMFVPLIFNVDFSKPLMPNHKDGVKWHNEPYNLEWVDNAGNIQHAKDTNLISNACGEDNGSAKLTDDQYRKICQLTQDGYLPYQINKILNLPIDITNICQKIRMGKTLTIISNEYDFSKIPKNDYRKFTDEQVHEICRCLQDYPEMKYIDIINHIGIDTSEMDSELIKKYRDGISTIKRRVSRIEIGNNYLF